MLCLRYPGTKVAAEPPSPWPTGRGTSLSELHEYCLRCGFPFKEPTTQQECEHRSACDRRQSDPSYRVPRDRLSAVEVRVRWDLIERVQETDLRYPLRARITYKDLCGKIDPDEHYWAYPRFRGIGKVLGRISTFEHENGRPLLSCLVVQQDSRKAGPGFAMLARELGFGIPAGGESDFWRSQVEAVVRYWNELGKGEPAPDPVAQAMELITHASEQLEQARRLLDAVQR